MDIDINHFLNREEDDFLEYKEFFTDEKIAQSIAAFSTSKGGLILVGVTDSGTPTGVTCDEDEIRKRIFNIVKNMDGGRPILDVHFNSHSSEKKIISIKIAQGSEKPYGWKGSFYKRQGSSNYKLDAGEISNISLRSRSISFDTLQSQIYNRDAVISDLNPDKMQEFTSIYNKSKRNKFLELKDIKSFLTTFNLITQDNNVNNASILFFGKEPQQAFPNSKINLLIYSGNEAEASKLKFKKFIIGNLISQIEETIENIKVSTENKVIMDGLNRIEINQYPLEAIREAIINAVAHRDYSIYDSFITIRLFENRLEITNPGGLLEGLSIEDLKQGGLSKRRNRIICNLFDNIGLMEQSGQGITSIISSLTKVGLKEPLFKSEKDYFRIEFYGQQINSKDENSTLMGKLTDLTKHLTPLQIKGLDNLNKTLKKEITIKEYMEIINTNSRITAKAHLDKFKELGILKSDKIGKSVIYEKLF